MKNTTECFYRVTNLTINQIPGLAYNIMGTITDVMTAAAEDPTTPDHANRLLAASNTLGYYIGGMI